MAMKVGSTKENKSMKSEAFDSYPVQYNMVSA